MSVAHEHVQEVLAGYALHALDGRELATAEELLATHVPGCDECRRALDDFGLLAGELALATGSRTPPRLLWVRLRRELKAGHGGRAWVGLGSAAVAVAVVAGMAVWNARLTTRIGHAEDRQATSAEVLTAVSHPASRVVPLPIPSDRMAGSDVPAQLAAAVIPGRSVLYVFGSLPPPTNGRVYIVWLSTKGRYVNVAAFVPERGSVMLAVRVNPSGYDGLLITEEAREGSDAPSGRHLTEVSL